MGFRSAKTVSIAGVVVLAAAMVVSFQSRPAFGQATKPTFAGTVKPIITKFCLKCHSGSDPAAGIDLVKGLATGAQDIDLWQRVSRNVTSAHMPPEGSPAPSLAQRRALKAAIDAIAAKATGPGHVTLRRLNRAEYDNTIRDLLGINGHPSANFPSDDVGYGFDNIGDVLSISPLLAEKYLNAAIEIAKEAIPLESNVAIRKFGPDFPAARGTNELANGERMMFTNSTLRSQYRIASYGTYRLRILARGELAGNELPKLQVTVDGLKRQIFDVGSTKPALYEMPLELKSGSHEIAVSYINDYYNDQTKADRNLAVTYVEVSGPILDNTAKPESYRRIIPHDVEKQDWDKEAPTLIGKFARRAYRRPLKPGELDALVKVFQSVTKTGGNFDEGMQAVVAATLVSPQFLFRVEPKPETAIRKLDDWELASRLSYFLWSSMPDDDLFDAARSGALHQPEVLAGQVKRMLKDPRSSALADNFAEQWLQLRKLANFFPDRTQFPEFDGDLKADIATETKMFFQSVVRNDRPILDFVNGRYTYLNDRLAKFYGVNGVEGKEFRRYEFSDPNRAGLLTQASVLCVTSNPTRTSPTKRGRWVLEELLGTPPPPPPPGVGVITNEKAALTATTLRKLMEEHRKNPACAACHAAMDPIGFGLENFDPVGRWRTMEGKFPVDSSGVLPGGQKFSGPAELRKILVGNKLQFYRAFTEKLMTYALGRGVEARDSVTLDKAVQKEQSLGFKFSSVVLAIVRSDPFQRQGT